MSGALELKVVLNVHVSTGEPALSVARFVAELERTLGRRVAGVEVVPAKLESSTALPSTPAAPIEESGRLTIGRRPCGCGARGRHRADCPGEKAAP